MPKLSQPPRVAHLATRYNPELMEAAELAKENPGEWVELDGMWSHGYPSQINRGEHPVFGEGFKATGRSVPDPESGTQRCTVWVQYVEPGESDDAVVEEQG